MHRLGILIENGIDHRLVVIPLEGAPAGEHLVKHYAQGPNIGAVVDALAAGLLRRHVGDRSRGGLLFGDLPGSDQFGQSEVHDLGLVFGADHDVGRFDVPVDDALLVSLPEAPGHLDGDPEGLARIHGTGLDPVLQALSFDIRHGDKGLSVGLVDLEDGADIGMIQSRGGPGLAYKTLLGLRIAGQLRRQKLQGDGSAQADILGLIDHSHAALADLFQDLVM